MNDFLDILKYLVYGIRGGMKTGQLIPLIIMETHQSAQNVGRFIIGDGSVITKKRNNMFVQITILNG